LSSVTYYESLINSNFDPDGEINKVPWRCSDGKYLFYDSNDSKWYISATFGKILQISGSDCTTKWYNYNGKKYYQQGSLYLWYSGSQYIINNYLGYGTETTNSYWYRSSKTGTYAAGGVATGTKTVAWKTVVGWERSNVSPFGEYTAIGGETGTKFVGLRQLTGSGITYTEQLTQYNSNDVYVGTNNKRLWYSNTYKYVISSAEGATSGDWWKNSELEGNYAYQGDNHLSNITIAKVAGYTEGSNKKTRYMTEVGQWL
jgi:hypothetical protein